MYYYPYFIGRVLEIGPGMTVPYFQDYVGLDISKIALKKISKIHSSVLGDGEALPFKDHSFDTICCYNVLEHVPNVVKFLSEMIRASKKRIIIIGPNYKLKKRFVSELTNKEMFIFIRSWILRRFQHFTLIPRLVFDNNWDKDADAISAVNILFVRELLKRRNMRIKVLTTLHELSQKRYFRILGKLAPFKYMGAIMVVVADKSIKNLYTPKKGFPNQNNL